MDLKKYRDECGLSQNFVADYLGVTRQTISKWENGKSYPDIDSLIELSSLYSVSIDELVGNSKRNINKDDKGIDKEKFHIILAIISSLSSIGIFIAIAILLDNIRSENKNKKVILICILCICFNILRILHIVYRKVFI